MQLRCFAVFFILMSGVARANESEAKDPTSEDHTRVSIGAEGHLYRSVITPSLFPFAILDAATEKHWDEYELNADIKLRLGLRNLNANVITSQNAYFGEVDQSYETPLRFSFGRRQILWSEADEIWNLGTIQPLDNWDRLRPRSQGLTGIFAYTETQKLNFRMFLSYLAFPEMGPNVVIENDQFKSAHPQAVSAGPQTVSIQNQPTPLGYHLDIPPISKIILRPSFAFMMESKPEIPFTGRVMYGYMPLNYFPLAVPLQGALSIPLNQLVLNIQPRLVQHHIYSADVGYRFTDRLNTGFSLMIDDPVAENLSTDYMYTPLKTSTTMSPWIRYRWDSLKLTLSQLWVNGGIEQDVPAANFQSYVSKDKNFVSSHVFYRSASQLKADWSPLTSNTAPTFSFKYVHEYSTVADWISMDVILRTKQHLTFVIGGDLIQAQKDNASSLGGEFLADMKALDRIRMGVMYEF